MKNKVVRLMTLIFNPIISVLWTVNIFLSESLAQAIISSILALIFAFFTGITLMMFIDDIK